MLIVTAEPKKTKDVVSGKRKGKKKKVPKRGTGQADLLRKDSRQLYNPMAGQAAESFFVIFQIKHQTISKKRKITLKSLLHVSK